MDRQEENSEGLLTDGWIKIPQRSVPVSPLSTESYKEFPVYYTISLKILNLNICVSYQNLFLNI